MCSITWTADEFKNYLAKQDSLGDALYNLNDENIAKANHDDSEESDKDDSIVEAEEDLVEEDAYLEQ